MLKSQKNNYILKHVPGSICDLYREVMRANHKAISSSTHSTWRQYFRLQMETIKHNALDLRRSNHMSYHHHIHEIQEVAVGTCDVWICVEHLFHEWLLGTIAIRIKP